jgi:hypothetical protein
MQGEDGEEKQPTKGPSTYTLSFSGIIAVAALVASGVATYNSLQNDIASLKRGETYQALVNQQAREERIAIRDEHRETARELNNKMDTMIEYWQRKK